MAFNFIKEKKTSLDDYLKSLSNQTVSEETVHSLKQQIQSITIDQLEDEATKIKTQIHGLQSDFAKDELSKYADDTIAICSVHEALFSPDGQNLTAKLAASNANVRHALAELKAVLTATDRGVDRLD
jgi:uncharacterized protein YdcH (DUF465 family)